MSMNLHLAMMEENGDLLERCDLFQTPTRVTHKILYDVEPGTAQTRLLVMLRYFEWIDEFLKNEPGHALDHKLAVATFLVKHPKAIWYAG